jgi:hypothetical protein
LDKHAPSISTPTSISTCSSCTAIAAISADESKLAIISVSAASASATIPAVAAIATASTGTTGRAKPDSAIEKADRESNRSAIASGASVDTPYAGRSVAAVESHLRAIVVPDAAVGALSLGWLRRAEGLRRFDLIIRP